MFRPTLKCETANLFIQALRRWPYVETKSLNSRSFQEVLSSRSSLCHPHVCIRAFSYGFKWRDCVQAGGKLMRIIPQVCQKKGHMYWLKGVSHREQVYTSKQHKNFVRAYCSTTSHQTSGNKVTNMAPDAPHKTHGVKRVQPLASKRAGRRRKGLGSRDTCQEVYDVTAYAPSEEIDLESLVQELQRHGLYTVVPFPADAEDLDDSLHVEAKYKVDNQAREIFFFRDGAVVFWNMPEEEHHNVMKFIRPHQEHSYDPLLVEAEVEHMQARYGDAVTQLVGDEIQLERQEDSSTEARSNQLEKYSFSNALALSVKLAIWEASLETYVDSIEYILEDLKEGKKLKISRQEVLRKTGEVLTLRHLINLSSDLLDVPDFYWDREELEALYRKTCQQHSIGRRVKVMNEKLNHCYELTGLLREHLNDKHHTHLEVLIIFLIAVEVIFEIIKMV